MSKLIAFYLPQYHPIPENDAWWGKGFTEWTNVSKARPLFKEHFQPQLPADLGFYDLRVDEVREEQARLASSYGIYGFCYYYYWFNGRRLLERPLDAMLASGKPDFPFCICWANETWSRRWDGSEHEILVEQVHTKESDKRFIESAIPILKDPRYIKIGGAPLLLIYRMSLLPDPVATTETWRKACREAGIEKLHIAAVRSFGIEDPRLFGCDSAVEFPPHGIAAGEVTSTVEDLDPKFEGKIYDYRDLIGADEFRTKPPYAVFPGVMPAWDNTARRGLRGHVFHNASPQAYEIWLRNALERAANEPVEGEQIVFINAWNEWAEGAHLEPDKRWGHQYLVATRQAMRDATDWKASARAIRSILEESSIVATQHIDSLTFRIEALEAANAYLKRQVDLTWLRKQLDSIPMKPQFPKELVKGGNIQPGLLNIEQVNNSVPGANVRVRSEGQFFVKGWAFAPGVSPTATGRQTFLLLLEQNTGEVFWNVLQDWETRQDVSQAFSSLPRLLTIDSGFSCVIDVKGMPNGRYVLSIFEKGQNQNSISFSNTCFEIR